MLLLALLLVPAVLATSEERIIDNHVVRIEDGTLTSVRATEKSSLALDLSDLGLRDLKRGVFDHLTTLRSLNLANNSLSSVPERSFTKLSSLEHLSLASNNLSDFRKAFFGLDNLRTLNISYNPVPELGGCELHGLPNTSVILTRGLNLSRITVNVFDRPSRLPDYDYEESSNEKEKRDLTAHVEDDDDEYVDEEPKRSRLHVKLCIEDGVVTLAEPINDNETLPSGCRRIPEGDYINRFHMSKLGITGFARGWCRLNETKIQTLYLVGNEITEVTRDTLNEIPFFGYNLAFNRIERLARGTIDNEFVTALNLSSNRIREIEDGALANTGLFELYLSDNQLEDTKFLASLPSSMRRIDLGFNRITSISPNSFARLNELIFLSLNGNRIERLDSDAFRGLPKLQTLSLSNNRISIIESGCFQRTSFLHFLYLRNNSISRFEKGVFREKSRITYLDAGVNRVSSMREAFPEGLPAGLHTLKLDDNRIERLDRGDFSMSPKTYLSLTGNRISKIEPGAFDLDSLSSLDLRDNKLGQLDVEAFRGLSHVSRLSLGANGIDDIPKGFTRVFRMLQVLNLDFNPIKRLRNGAFVGLGLGRSNHVTLSGVPVEVIEAGIFEDM